VEFEVVVVGSGGGALAGAYTAAAAGLSTVVLEKAEVCGGVTAYSGGNVFLPGNPHALAAGLADSVERGRTFLRAVLGDADAAKQDAFLEVAPGLVGFLEQDPALRFVLEPMPEYFDAPGRLPGGSQVSAAPVKASALDPEVLALVRQSIGPDRWGTDAPREELFGGQALVARFLQALKGLGAQVRTGTAVDRLVVEDGRVVGVEAATADGRVTVRARYGVLLASGGFERNQELRDRFGVPGQAVHSMAPRGTSAGEPLLAGIEAGAATAHLKEAWFCPALVEPDGSAGFLIGFRGGVIVDGKGRRYANESLPYDRFGREMAKADATESWWVFDSREGGRTPGIRCVPGSRRQDYLDSGAWVGADTVAELADLMGVPAAALEDTVGRWNGFAAQGVDDDFRRGEDEFDRRWVFPNEAPNPCLLPIDRGPFFAAKVVLGDLGTKGGLLTDVDARVLREDGSVIAGLFATGNTMASMTGAFYPAPGCPIGTAMVFGYRAVQAMAQSPST
jgi:3-oxosteroid 1-dehydrogenase